MRKYLLILTSMSLFLSEILLRINPTIGFLSYTLLISGCMIALSKEEELDNYGKLIVALMILPVIRIEELFIEFEFLWRSFIVYYILFFLVMFYSVKFRINPGYTKEGLSFLPLVILIGITLGLMGSLLFNFEEYAGLLFLLPVLVFSEEMLFRGMLQNLIGKEYSGFSAVFFTSLLYGIFSLGYGLPIALFFFGISLVLSLIYHLTKNIFLTISLSFILHFLMLALA